VADVRITGASPAWSADGSTLAFSAMPADLSTGPDLYVWRDGDASAQRVTSDHRTYFASWSGNRIVVSRPAAAAGSGEGSIPRIATIVLDPVAGDESQVQGPEMWLPAVDPTGRYAVAWMGSLTTDGPALKPKHGALYLLDWASLDTAAQPSSGGDVQTAGRAPVSSGGVRATLVPAAPAPSNTPRSRKAPRNPATDGTPVGTPADTSPTPGSAQKGAATLPQSATTTAAPPTAAGSAQALDPGRDPTTDPVLDWVVRWSDDGSALAYWVADAPGSTWGGLTAVRIVVQGGHFAPEALLGPSLAQRAFSMGSNRIAWMAPSDGQDRGELRVRTWDSNGYGDLRIRTVDTGDGIPTF
jgi:WD40-like Beta Propeller Repeat